MSVTAGELVDLDRLVAHAFAEGGPLHRLIRQHLGPDEPYRRAQASGAQTLAQHLRGAESAAQVQVLVQQVGSGLGKTLMIGVVLAFYTMVADRRAMIATWTTQLRRDLQAAADLINAVVRETLRDLDQPPPRPVTFAERKSCTAYVSPQKVAQVREWLATGMVPADQRRAVEAFIAWHEDSASQELSDWLATPASGGKLFMGLKQIDLSLRPSDFPAPTPSGSVAHFLAQRDRAEQADIVLVTHSMLLRNSLGWGTTLGTREVPEYRQAQSFGSLVIDEADKLPSMADQMLAGEVSLSVLSDILNSFEPVTDGQIEARMEAQLALIDLERFIRQHSTSSGGVTFARGSPALAGLVNLVTALRAALVHLRTRLTAREMAITRDSLGDIIDDLHAIADRDVDDEWMVRYGQFSPLDVSLGQRQRAIRQHIVRFWRPGKAGKLLHSFDSIAFYSATLQGGGSSYANFLRKIGVDSARGDICRTPAPLLVREFGRYKRVLVLERDPGLFPTGDEADRLNFAHCDAVVQGIQQARRSLTSAQRSVAVLCTSYAQQNALIDRLVAAGLGDSVVPFTGGDARHAIGRLASLSHGIWIAVAWEGINLVHPETGLTLPEIVILSKLPVPPTHPHRIARMGFRAAVLDQFDDAYSRAAQGAMRASRSYRDLPELWIMDGRCPLPKQAEQRLWLGLPLRHDTGNYMAFLKLFWGVGTTQKCRRFGIIDRHGQIKEVSI